MGELETRNLLLAAKKAVGSNEPLCVFGNVADEIRSVLFGLSLPGAALDTTQGDPQIKAKLQKSFMISTQ